MKKQTLMKAYSIFFIAVCAVPFVCMSFAMTKDNGDENRKLAEFPTIKNEDGGINTEYFSQFDDWFSDHFAFRRELVTADGRLKTTLTATSPNSSVILGRNGWLYYGDTTDDYLRINTLSDMEIYNIVHNLRMIDDYCSQNDATFLFFSAPNKNSVYPENMPINYMPSDNQSNYEMLAERLSSDGFWLDMKAALKGTSSSIPLYHKTDTHWNNLGAYAAHTAVMNHLGLQPCTAGNWFTRNDRKGDLAKMIYPAEKAKDTQVYSDYDFTYEYQGLFRGLDDPRIATTSASDGDLLMFRDSYGEAILQYMAESFGKAEFLRTVPYSLMNVSGRTVVLEIVERNLGNLQKYAPMMPAPEADISGYAPNLCFGNEEVIESEEKGAFRHIYGVLPDEYFSGNEHTIYVTTGGKTYQAFNCYEDKLLGHEGEHSGKGFSLYIPLDAATDKIKVTVINRDGYTMTSH